MAFLNCPKCKMQFDSNKPGVIVAGVGAGALLGGFLGSSIGIVGGPIGGIAGTVPGAILGAVIVGLGVKQIGICPSCKAKFFI